MADLALANWVDLLIPNVQSSRLGHDVAWLVSLATSASKDTNPASVNWLDCDQESGAYLYELVLGTTDCMGHFFTPRMTP